MPPQRAQPQVHLALIGTQISANNHIGIVSQHDIGHITPPASDCNPLCPADMQRLLHAILQFYSQIIEVLEQSELVLELKQLKSCNGAETKKHVISYWRVQARLSI